METYYLNKQWRPSLLGIGIAGFIFFVFLVIIISFLDELALTDMLCFIPFVLMPVELLYESLYSRIEISKEGVVYRQPRFTLRCKWEDLIDVMIGASGYTLLFTSAQIQYGKWLAVLLKALGPWDRAVPLDPYVTRQNAIHLRDIISANAQNVKPEAREFLEDILNHRSRL